MASLGVSVGANRIEPPWPVLVRLPVQSVLMMVQLVLVLVVLE